LKQFSKTSLLLWNLRCAQILFSVSGLDNEEGTQDSHAWKRQ